MKNFVVTIELDCSPRLEQLLSVFAGAALTGITPKRDEAELQVSKNGTENARVEVVPQRKEQPAEETARNDEVPAKPKKTEEVSDAEVRAHIKACRERLLMDLNGDERVSTHSALTQMLRDKVAEYGVEKASELPQDKRAEFIHFCDTLENVDIPF